MFIVLANSKTGKFTNYYSYTINLVKTGENLIKVCENSRAGENPLLCLGFSLLCSQVLPNICLSFHQAMKAWKT